jgi:hypothetical protein
LSSRNAWTEEWMAFFKDSEYRPLAITAHVRGCPVPRFTIIKPV